MSRSCYSNTDVFNLEDGRDIYAIGDIHGDFRAMLICLRDCCKVIERVGEFDPNVEDANLIKCLESESLICDYGYRWVPRNNSFVVFLGDLIDNNRDIKGVDKKPIEYPFEEVKICLFINEMKKQAFENGGYIISLLGNHDFINLFPFNGVSTDESYKFIDIYTTGYAKSIKTEGGQEREKIFNIDVLGHKLLCDCWTGIFVQINDFIFTHAGFGKDIIALNSKGNKYIDILDHSLFNLNQLKIYNKIIRNLVALKSQFRYSEAESRNEILEILQNRNVADPKIVYDVNSSPKVNRVYCETIQKVFRDYDSDSRYLRLVVGHSPQFSSAPDKVFSSKARRPVTTFMTHHRDKENRTVILTFPAEISEYNSSLGAYDDLTNLYGITMDCSMNSENSMHAIYRLDVGMANTFDIAFEDNEKYTKIKERSERFEDPEEFLLTYFASNIKARCPQVLHIHIINSERHEYNVEIIRSTVRNTLIHQKRGPLQPDFPIELIRGFT